MCTCSVIFYYCSLQVFGAVFRTPPEDSTGVPHILEHSVLCGSRKYPVKEPFVDLLKVL
jgi:presequence protease